MLRRLVQRHAHTFRPQFRPGGSTFRLNRVQAIVGVSAIGVLALGVAGAALDTGTHMWLEHKLKRIKADVDPQIREWGWDLEVERWTGDPSQGGTDAALGRQGRKAVRNAWFSHHRPEKYGPLDEDDDVVSNGNINMVDAVLLRTELCLRRWVPTAFYSKPNRNVALSAIAIAEQREVVGKLHPCTLPDLLTRHAAILERLGPSYLSASSAQYSRVFRLLGETGLEAARIAVKIGDLNQRLGQGPDALGWWARAIQLATDNEPSALVPTVPTISPSSPAAQRVLTSALVSASAFYAMARELGQAQKIEEGALDLLRSIQSPDSLASTPPSQALHSLLLLQRSAIFGMHLAEVLYAQRAPVAECVTRLQAAATSSERVAYALVGTSVRESDQLVPSAEDRLLAGYGNSPYLEKPASDLLRDARRSAADSWNLMGELTERLGPSHRQLAFKYYTRAVGWAGRTTADGKMEAADSTLADDWMLLWRNYERMKKQLIN
ncbi:hypothetical protein C8R47DRAFT_1115074 [Mycena vitilis]|nr:hypothetical protein C8R47DRAFT_1115074 [Mycena vitilis]